MAEPDVAAGRRRRPRGAPCRGCGPPPPGTSRRSARRRGGCCPSRRCARPGRRRGGSTGRRRQGAVGGRRRDDRDLRHGGAGPGRVLRRPGEPHQDRRRAADRLEARRQAGAGVEVLRALRAVEAEVLRAHEHHRVRGVHERGRDRSEPRDAQRVARPARGQELPGDGAARIEEVERDPGAACRPRRRARSRRGTAASPPSTGTRARISFLVLVLWMRTTVSRLARRDEPLVDREGPDRRRACCRSCPCSRRTAG